jgi:hypothetical protein
MINNMVIKKLALVLTTLLIANTTWAESYSKEEKTTNFIVTPSVAYRYDVFKYSIPDDKFINKKLSELTWKNYIIQPSIKIETEPQPNQFTFLAQTKYSYILKNHSESWDRDWHIHQQKSGNLKSTPDSKTLSSVKGNILDLSGAVGYSFNLPKNSLLTFYVGYDYSDYRNKNYGARQLVDQNDIVIPFDQLFQKYNFKTQSPWIGLSVKSNLNDKFSIIPTIKLYSFKYVGKGYWLLRDDLKQDPSIKHNARGKGLGFDVDFIYKYSNNLDFKVNLETKYFKMKKGTKSMFFAADPVFNEPEKVGNSKLLNLLLISSSISGGVRYKF